MATFRLDSPANTMRIDSSVSPAGQSSGRSSPRSGDSSSRHAWALLGWIGIAFVALGFADIGIGVFPTAFGNPEWEFGTISTVLNGFAIPTMGAYLFLASSIARNQPVVTRAASVCMLAIALILIVLGLMYVSVIPTALSSVEKDPVVTLGMQKAIAKAIALMVAYWILYIAGGFKGWKTTSSAKNE